MMPDEQVDDCGFNFEESSSESESSEDEDAVPDLEGKLNDLAMQVRAFSLPSIFSVFL